MKLPAAFSSGNKAFLENNYLSKALASSERIFGSRWFVKYIIILCLFCFIFHITRNMFCGGLVGIRCPQQNNKVPARGSTGEEKQSERQHILNHKFCTTEPQ